MEEINRNLYIFNFNLDEKVYYKNRIVLFAIFTGNTGRIFSEE